MFSSILSGQGSLVIPTPAFTPTAGNVLSIPPTASFQTGDSGEFQRISNGNFSYRNLVIPGGFSAGQPFELAWEYSASVLGPWTEVAGSTITLPFNDAIHSPVPYVVGRHVRVRLKVGSNFGPYSNIVQITRAAWDLGTFPEESTPSSTVTVELDGSGFPTASVDAVLASPIQSGPYFNEGVILRIEYTANGVPFTTNHFFAGWPANNHMITYPAEIFHLSTGPFVFISASLAPTVLIDTSQTPNVLGKAAIFISANLVVI